jgi:hypothetical protein
VIRGFFLRSALLATLLSIAGPGFAAARDTLIRAAFATPDKAQAISLVQTAIDETRATLAAHAGDREARLQLALGTGYRGQLKRSPGDAKSSHTMLTDLARDYPRDAEVQIAFAGWHLTAVADLGPFLARTVLGANKDAGFAALDRAIALGGNRAFFPAYAALIRARLDTDDTRTPIALAERAAAAPAPQGIDRVMQRAAQRLLVPLRAGDGSAAAKLAKRLLPFGDIG